jgi:hypothetical protein
MDMNILTLKRKTQKGGYMRVYSHPFFLSLLRYFESLLSTPGRAAMSLEEV